MNLIVLTRNDLRLLFMREGKIAGVVWPWHDAELSGPARAHLLALLDAVRVEYGELGEDDRDSLLAIFTASARKSRTPEGPNDQQAIAATPNALHARLGQAEEGAREQLAARDAAWTAPTVEALEIVNQVCADPAAGVTEEVAAVLFSEVGRLTAPLWITGDWDHVPELTHVAANSLDSIVPIVVRPERRFDESRSEFFFPSDEEIRNTLASAMIDSLRANRIVYFRDHPPPGPLPTDPQQRTLEQERRAEERAAATRRALNAIDQITEPLFAAVGQYASERAAEARAHEAAAEAEARAHEAAAESEVIAARAKDGFLRPEAQRYGVSARGAEFWVADALRWLGIHDADVTQSSADGGVDVLSERLAVSVKHYVGAVPVEEVREIFGVAMALRRSAVLWTSGTLTETARQFAELAPVAVVRYDVADAVWAGLTVGGEEFLASLDASVRGDEP